MRFRLIDQAKKEFPVHRLCNVLGVSESGYFAWKGRPASRRQNEDMVLLAHIRAQFSTSNETYGAPRMHVELKEEGLAVGRHRVALMRGNGLKALQRRYKKTTDSNHGGPVAVNLLDQDFGCDDPDQKWGADISYIWTAEGWLYLAIVLDLYSRRIIGCATSDRLKKDLALNALRRAIAVRQPSPGLIQHTDRGRGGLNADQVAWAQQIYYGGITAGYLEMRDSILSWTSEAEPWVYLPGYPAFLAVLYEVGVKDLAFVRFAQIVIDSLAIFPLYFVLFHISRSAYPALVGCVIYAVAPWWSSGSTYLLAESLLPALVIFQSATMVAIRDRAASSAGWFVLGLSSAILPFFRSEMVLMRQWHSSHR